MKLKRADFKNFRLLRDLCLNFESSTNKKLTVIRAENESGKTTILTALQWALYGDQALPSKRSNYRLHPIDWDDSDGQICKINVSVDFETKSVRESSTHGTIETIKNFRIIRSTYETINNNQWEIGPTCVNLLELTKIGSDPIKYPEAFIKEELPNELREVFFTDGDRALSFIEANVSASTKRDRVQNAIRSLLGLDVIKGALTHVKKTAFTVNKRVSKAVSNHKVADAAETINKLETERDDIERQIQNADQQFKTYDEEYVKVQKQIEDALVQGNKSELKHELEETREKIEYFDKQLSDTSKKHTALLRSLALSRELMAPVIKSSLAILDDLRERGEIPNSTIPVLEQCLDSSTCICGEPLSGLDIDAIRRKEHIRNLIKQSRDAKERDQIVTDLYFASRPLQTDQITNDQHWSTQFESVAKQIDEISVARNNLGTKQRALEAQIRQMPDTNIEGLRQIRSQYREQRDRFNRAAEQHRTELKNLEQDLSVRVIEYRKLLRQQHRGDKFLANLTVAKDIERVLDRAYERLTTEELQNVSNKMNENFLKMIGSDPSQGALIRNATITEQFEITVYGPNDRLLNPDKDLNGASRRALTLAFILALTQVSGVEAPNVIDTPLGMMSGYVKTSVLDTAIGESSQLILFLTRSEIRDCEKILDEKAANVITLTNPAHYPVMLINEPQVDKRTILRCDCNHRQECTVCQRVSVSSIDLTSTT